MRTPNCDNPTLNLCYNLDSTNVILGVAPCAPVSQFQWGNNCYAVSGRYHPPGPNGCNPHEYPAADGLCYKVYAPDYPCEASATQVGNYCFVMPLGAEFRDSLSTTAKVIFIGSCQTTDIFINWWNLNLNSSPGGRALVVPDIATMTARQAQDVPASNTGFVDLQQAAVGYEKFVQTLVQPGKTVQNAVDAANAAIAAFYPTEVFSSGGKLPQVIFKPIGRAGLCLRGVCQ